MTSEVSATTIPAKLSKLLLSNGDILLATVDSKVTPRQLKHLQALLRGALSQFGLDGVLVLVVTEDMHLNKLTDDALDSMGLMRKQ
jgi:hypothetical protein